MFSKLGLTLGAALILSGTAGNPDSVDYANRVISAHSPMYDEINSAEAGSPDSVDNKDQRSPPPSENWRAAWQAAESEHPDFG